MTDDLPATASWDTRTLKQLTTRGHSFEEVEKTFEGLSTARLFVVARGLIVILNEEVAPHPDVTDPNEKDIRFVADRITACLSVVERRLMAFETASK